MNLRANNITKLQKIHFDALVVGGGINGAVSAAALSGKGAKVALIDRKDFASETSQESSNLAWGGIKYLESLEFGLVRKLCKSRNHLIKSYPSSVQEIRFFTTIEKGFRFPVWFIWLGTWFYWLIGNFFTRRPRYLSRRRIHKDEPIINTTNAVGGIEYSDAYLHDNDARFVFSFVRSAMNNGCIAANYLEALSATRSHNQWHVDAVDTLSGKKLKITADVIVNACGPYADIFNAHASVETKHQHVFSKGIHLIVNRLSKEARVLTFFADDGRLFFAIPMGAKTCIGTTDTRMPSPEAYVTEEDRDFVLGNINKRLKLDKPLTRADIIAERCGVRPLVTKRNTDGGKDWMQMSRKHEVEANFDTQYITIFGGKLTDCLNVGDEVSELVENMGIHLRFGKRRWYGEGHDSVRDDFFHQAKLMDLDSYTASTSHEKLSTRFWRRYGSHALELLEKIRENPEQAEILIEGAEYTRCEIEEAAQREMVTKLEDFLRRRSKIALVMRKEEIRMAKGIHETCKILFGSQAKKKYDEYFAKSAGAIGKKKSSR
ncbi:MAG: Glycerol-3-phosphate dehydrogenase 2 [Turneriella sp.]|nr:Glycerol-3-phosphate dehydrogenase 2 [Turneriella sp.]